MKKILCIFLVCMLLCISVLPAFAEGGAEFSVTDAPAEGEISAMAASLAFRFSDDIDSSTLGGITFKKEDGTEVKGGYFVTLGNTPDEVVITFGVIENGTYKVSVSEALMSIGGVSATSAEYTYTVSDYYDVSYQYFMELDDISEGIYTNEEIQAMLSNTIFGAGERDGVVYGSYTVMEDDGGKFIRSMYKNAPASVGTSLIIRLDDAVTSGRVRIGYKFRAMTDSLNRNLLTFRSDSANIGLTLRASTNSGLTLATGSVMAMADKATYTATLDDEGFMSVSYEVARKSSSDDWSVTVFDEYSAERTVIATATIAKSKMTGVQYLRLFDTWPSNGAANSDGAPTDIKDIFIETNEQEIAYKDELIAPDASDIRFAFRYDEHSCPDVVLTRDSDGSVIEAACVMTDNRLCRVQPVDYLSYGENYTVYFSDGIYEDIHIRTLDYGLTIGEATIEDGVMSVPLSNTSFKPKTVLVFVAALDAQGKVLSIKTDTLENFTGTEYASIDVSQMAGVTYSSYVWEDMGDYSVSAIEPIPLAQGSR